MQLSSVNGEKYRIVQDRLFQSDFDKYLGELPFIDEIDDALGVVYDLLPEELQYVKSFKLKYRLSNDEQ